MVPEHNCHRHWFHAVPKSYHFPTTLHETSVCHYVSMCRQVQNKNNYITYLTICLWISFITSPFSMTKETKHTLKFYRKTFPNVWQSIDLLRVSFNVFWFFCLLWTHRQNNMFLKTSINRTIFNKIKENNGLLFTFKATHRCEGGASLYSNTLKYTPIYSNTHKINSNIHTEYQNMYFKRMF